VVTPFASSRFSRSPVADALSLTRRAELGDRQPAVDLQLGENAAIDSIKILGHWAKSTDGSTANASEGRKTVFTSQIHAD
jgi:hypothetical protein